MVNTTTRNNLGKKIAARIKSLDKLAVLLSERAVNNIEIAAIQRNLQVLIGAAVVVAKHWLSELGYKIKSKAHDCFTELDRLGLLGKHSLNHWVKIITLRDTLIHDYMNSNEEAVIDVVQKREYYLIRDFYQHACQNWPAES